jgi:hypothetical protein
VVLSACSLGFAASAWKVDRMAAVKVLSLTTSMYGIEFKTESNSSSKLMGHELIKSHQNPTSEVRFEFPFRASYGELLGSSETAVSGWRGVLASESDS